MNQRRFVRWGFDADDACELVYPAKALLSNSSASLHAGVSCVSPTLSCDSIKSFCLRKELVCIFDLADAMAANPLVTWHWVKEIPRLLAIHSRCDLHQVHLATTWSIKKLELLSPMYSLYTQANFATSQLKFLVAVQTLLAPSEIEWIIFREPLQEERDYAKWVLDHTLMRWCQPGLVAEGQIFQNHGAAANEHEREQRIRGICSGLLAVWTGNWRDKRIQHVCIKDDNGFPCCSSKEEASEKLAKPFPQCWIGEASFG